jgi:hypothetical protein
MTATLDVARRRKFYVAIGLILGASCLSQLRKGNFASAEEITRTRLAGPGAASAFHDLEFGAAGQHWFGGALDIFCGKARRNFFEH